MSTLSGLLGQLYVGWTPDVPPVTTVTDYAADKAAGVVSLARARALRNELANAGFEVDGAPTVGCQPSRDYMALAADYITASASFLPGKGPAGKGDLLTVARGLLYRDFLRSRQVSPAMVESLLTKLQWFTSNRGKGTGRPGADYAKNLAAAADNRMTVTFTGKDVTPAPSAGGWSAPNGNPWARPGASPAPSPVAPVDLSAAGEEIKDLVQAGYRLDEVLNEVLGGGKPAEVLPLREYRALRRAAPAASAPAAPAATEPTE